MSTRISDLPVADPLSGSELVPVVQDGTTKRADAGGFGGAYTADEVITVGSGGDFATINAALEAISGRHARYAFNGLEVDLHLLSGFVQQEQVLMRHIDLGWLRVTSEDAEVTIARSALTTAFSFFSYLDRYPAWGAQDNATFPKMDVLFNMDSSGTAEGRDGFVCRGNSRLFVAGGAGVKNAAQSAVVVTRGSFANLEHSIFTGADRGLHVTHFANVNAHGADFSDAGNRCATAIGGAVVNLKEAICNNATNIGVWVGEGAHVNLFNAFVNDCGSWANIYVVGGSADCWNVQAMNAENNAGINCDRGRVSAYNANASGAPQAGFRVVNGGIIQAADSTGSLSQTANQITANGIIFR